jgi:hypothetical protein
MRAGMWGLAALLLSTMLMVAGLGSQAGATPFTGTPSDGTAGSVPAPRFGTLIDFDEISIPANSDFAVLPIDNYLPDVVSIGELVNGSLVPLTVLPVSTQSPKNYILAEDVTGAAALTHTIQIRFKDPQARVGIGIIDEAGGQVLQIFDINHNSLEGPYSPQFSGGNAYAGFEESTAGITFLEISGKVFALDDLQFSPTTAVPEPTSVVLLLCGLAGAWLVRKR